MNPPAGHDPFDSIPSARRKDAVRAPTSVDRPDGPPAGWARGIERWNELSATDQETIHRIGDCINQPQHERAAKAARKVDHPDGKGKNFTTQYAVEWGRRQGWKLEARERFDLRTNRHHDLQGGSDCMFRKPDGTLVFVQGAGKGEREEHRRRFEERRRDLEDFRSWVFVFAVFVRGDKEPISVEEWT